MCPVKLKKLIRKNISQIKPYQPGKPIEELQREIGSQEIIKLASNENVLPPSAKVISAIKKSLNKLNRYPDGNCYYLKKKLAKKLKVNPANLIVGNGSDEIIVLALRAFLRPGEEVVIADPTFLIYKIAAQIEGAKIRFVPLKGLRYDLGTMASAVTKKTKIIFIANPDNPTGTYLTRSEIKRFLPRIPAKTIIFFDEAYFDFAKDCPDFPDTLKLTNRRNIITTRTFSKIHSLAGLRIGYGVATEEIVDYLNRVREPFNVNSLAQAAALAALDDTQHVKRTLEMVKKGKRYLYQQLNKLQLRYTPSATNFILINLNRDARPVIEGLLKNGLIVRNMTAWGLKDFVRVTIGTMKQNTKFINLLKIYLNRR